MPMLAQGRDGRGQDRDGFMTGPEAVSRSRAAGLDFGLPPWLEEQVRRVASNPSTILLGGETGTGKSRLARLIHEASPLRQRPFLAINCSALSEDLIESELFGHVKGAFTGADRDRVGRLAEVGEGTLFLDEIDSLPGSDQAKLLRVLEDRTFEAVGSNRSERFRARLVAAGNCPLERAVASGRFRADLFYRLNVVNLELPPLRRRREWIPYLAGAFVAEFSRRDGRPCEPLSSETIATLTAYHWPGNIRELRNALERAWVLSATGGITRDDLSPIVLAAAPDDVSDDSVAIEGNPVATGRGDGAEPILVPHASTLADAREKFERDHILSMLHAHHNNRSRVAHALGISRVTLYKKLHRYGIGVGPSGFQPTRPLQIADPAAERN